MTRTSYYYLLLGLLLLTLALVFVLSLFQRPHSPRGDDLHFVQRKGESYATPHQVL